MIKEGIMYSRRMMLAGVILIFSAIGIFAFGTYMIGEEANAIKKSARFYGGNANAVSRGTLVIIEGRVSMKNKLLVHDYVDAAKECYGNDADWSIIESYCQPVLVDLPPGEIILTSGRVCTRATGNNVLYTGEKTKDGENVRYTGLKRGDPVTAIGTVTAHSPAALAVKYWYSGSIDDYTAHLTSSRKNSRIFFMVLASMGAALFIWGWLRT